LREGGVRLAASVCACFALLHSAPPPPHTPTPTRAATALAPPNPTPQARRASEREEARRKQKAAKDGFSALLEECEGEGGSDGVEMHVCVRLCGAGEHMTVCKACRVEALTVCATLDTASHTRTSRVTHLSPAELKVGDSYDRAMRLLNHENRWKVRARV
jgi:hypothetical protein